MGMETKKTFHIGHLKKKIDRLFYKGLLEVKTTRLSEFQSPTRSRYFNIAKITKCFLCGGEITPGVTGKHYKDYCDSCLKMTN